MTTPIIAVSHSVSVADLKKARYLAGGDATIIHHRHESRFRRMPHTTPGCSRNSSSIISNHRASMSAAAADAAVADAGFGTAHMGALSVSACVLACVLRTCVSAMPLQAQITLGGGRENVRSVDDEAA
jgi:hypothetical protein